MDVLAILEEYSIEGVLTEEEFLTLCPFHNDTHPSCSINIEKEVFRCLSCDAHGDVINFLAAVTNISRAAIKKHLEIGTDSPTILSLRLIVKWNKALLKSKNNLYHLKQKGLNEDTIKKFLIGFDSKRITFPIFDKNGNAINVRKWLPGAVKKKMISIKGHGKLNLYPLANLSAKEIVITEGEIKALLLCQMNFNAITVTGGSKSWIDEWSAFFRDKRVHIIYDIDNAGKLGAQKIAKSLYCYTKEIYIIELPLDKTKYPTGDITDYIVALKHTKEDILKLFRKADKWEPFIYRETFDEKIYEVLLSNSTESKFFNRIIKTNIIVSAKDTAPYIIPFHVKAVCSKDQEMCAFCSCLKQEEFKIDKKHPVILEFINCTKTKQVQAIKKAAGIPGNCKVVIFEILEAMNIEEIRLIPQIQIAQHSSQHVVRQGFYIGHGIEPNANYTIQARVCTQPETQYATLLIFEAEPAIDNLSIFELKEDLSIFKPEEWTKESIEKRLKEIYIDFESNVTRIYKRPMLHLFYDLCYHSVLYIPFQGQIIKGWVEGLVLGDSGQGKSETILQLQKHYGVGERIDIKTCSIAGLIGGLLETAKRWFITWGIIPLNDKRLVVLEEIKGVSPEIIAKLTETRSSGIAEIAKIEKARTNARVRLIWISNPRTDRQILTYNFGVEAIKELIGNLEDIRRFDFAIILTVKDVDERWINLPLEKRAIIKHRFTAKLCQQLILWGWSRKADQITFTPEAIQEILKTASYMGSRYSSKIPLVESADQRLKLTRLATALAVRTFSTEDNATVCVRKCHVEYVSEYLEKIYSSAACGYLDYSNLIKKENEIKDKDFIIESLIKLPFAKSVVETFLDTKVFTIFDIIDWTELEVDECRKLIGLFVRNNAIKRYKRGYIKNQAFIALLKEMKEKELTNETRYDKATQEEF